MARNTKRKRSDGNEESTSNVGDGVTGPRASKVRKTKVDNRTGLAGLADDLEEEQANVDVEIIDPDDDVDFTRIKHRLHRCLSQVKPDKAFASFDIYADAVSPGLSIHGFGTVGLPPSQREARALSRFIRAASYDKGVPTAGKIANRNTQELDASQFDLQNPNWERILEGIKDRVAVELGIPGGCKFKAVPCKMLLYRPGAVSNPHPNLEKVPLEIGMLVICLPSQHQGGEVHLQYGDEEKIFKSAATSQRDYSYLCWFVDDVAYYKLILRLFLSRYTDVEHQVAAVTQGFRLALIYNLIIENSEPTERLTHLGRQKELKDLKDALASWRASLDNRSFHCPKSQADIAFENNLLGFMMKASMHLNDIELCKAVIRSDLPQPSTVKAVRHFGLLELRSSLAQVIGRFKNIPKRLESLNRFYNCYMELTTDPDPGILQWIREQTVETFSKKRNMESSDSFDEVGEVIRRYGECFTKKHIVSSLKRTFRRMKRDYEAQKIGYKFLSCIFAIWTDGHLRLEPTRALYSFVLGTFAKKFAIEGRNWEILCEKISDCKVLDPSPAIRYPVDLLRQCDALGFGPRLRRKIFHELAQWALHSPSPADDLVTFLLPMARHVYDTYPEDKGARKFVKTVVAAFGRRCVDDHREKPVLPSASELEGLDPDRVRERKRETRRSIRDWKENLRLATSIVEQILDDGRLRKVLRWKFATESFFLRTLRAKLRE
ncbi:MAG: hypothetical protein M1816_005633 [Peltula sp. TS41687]|nr:MAG: hypothetical protein M1816_005633 [Peltula sp. TS41687]